MVVFVDVFLIFKVMEFLFVYGLISVIFSDKPLKLNYFIVILKFLLDDLLFLQIKFIVVQQSVLFRLKLPHQLSGDNELKPTKKS
jgi:hypothetical protein